MTREEHLLTCLAEECCEVAQRVSKALRFGLSEVQAGQPLTNCERIVDELHDLWSVAVILASEGVLPESAGNMDPERVPPDRAKLAKIERFFAISRAQGTLTEGRK
jgi:hypothetical protein